MNESPSGGSRRSAVGRRRFLGASVGAAVGFGLTAGTGTAGAQSPSPVVWSAESGGTVREYLVDGTDVFVGTDRNRLRRLGRDTGEEICQVELPAGVYPSGIAATADHVVTATSNDQLSVYERSALAGSDATPVWEPPLSGPPMGMATDGGAVCVATRDGLVVFDPASQSFRWQRYTDDLEFENLAPPVAWTDAGLVVTGDTSVLFVSPESGEVEVTAGFDAPNHVNVLKKPPVAVASAGPYVGYSGADAHGCCPSWATLVIDTERREIEYSAFDRSSGQKSLGLTGASVAHRIDEQRLRFEAFGSGDRFRTNLSPRFDGLVSTSSRTFVADSSAEDATTRFVAIENEGYGEAWSHPFDAPISHLEAAGELLFGLDQEEGRLLALSPTGDRTDVAGTPTSAGTDEGSGGGSSGGSTTAGGTATNGPTGANAATSGESRAAGDDGGGGTTDGDAPRRGFFTNGGDRAVSGFGLTGASTAITVLGIAVTVIDMLRGDGN